MKESILLVILSFCFSSTQMEKQQIGKIDPLIGTWKIVKTVSVHIDNSEREYIHLPSKCFSSSRFVYKNDGSLYFKRVLENKETGECYEKPKDYWTGSWTKNNEGNYIRNYTFKHSKNDLSHSWDSTNVFTFSNNKKTLTVYDDFEKSGTSFPDKIIKAQYGVFQKINEK